jgi:hypothetical protein
MMVSSFAIVMSLVVKPIVVGLSVDGFAKELCISNSLPTEKDTLGGYKIEEFKLDEIEAETIRQRVYLRDWNPELFCRIEEKLLKHNAEAKDFLTTNRVLNKLFFWLYVKFQPNLDE